MHGTVDFTAYSRLADEMIDKATKNQLADVARLLALKIGYYREEYGDVPQEMLVGMVRAEMVRAEMLSDESKRLLLHGMQNLVSALGEVMGVAEHGDEARH
jgi:hypothetical protein